MRRAGLANAVLRGMGAVLLLAFAAGARADYFVIVHAGNPIEALTRQQVLNLFMGRTRAFPNKQLALPFDLPRDSAERAGFYAALTGMSGAQLNSYWSRLMFSGQVMPPLVLGSESTMLDIVRRNASAIGYVRHPPAADAGVKTVHVLEDVD